MSSGHTRISARVGSAERDEVRNLSTGSPSRAQASCRRPASPHRRAWIPSLPQIAPIKRKIDGKSWLFLLRRNRRPRCHFLFNLGHFPQAKPQGPANQVLKTAFQTWRLALLVVSLLSRSFPGEQAPPAIESGISVDSGKWAWDTTVYTRAGTGEHTGPAFVITSSPSGSSPVQAPSRVSLSHLLLGHRPVPFRRPSLLTDNQEPAPPLS